MSRGRNMARPESLVEESARSASDIQLDEFLEENVLPAIGNHRYYKLCELIETCVKNGFGRGYIQGGRDEKAW